jgi:hypothetical protein
VHVTCREVKCSTLNHYTIFNGKSQSVGLPLVLAGHFQWTVAAGLLIVHRSSDEKVQQTERSDQKWLDEQQKVSRKLLWLQSKKKVFWMPSV